MNDLISVILAVYNMENFLEESIKSIQNQTYPNLEIIAVNDCSTDSSFKKLQVMAKYDPRIKIINNEINMGPGPARNIGITKATGKYIAFLDPDDLFLPDAIKKLHAVATRHGSDLVKGTALKINYAGKSKGIYSNFVPSHAIINTTIRKFPSLWMSAEFWTYLYQKELLKNLEFPPLKLGEDFLFLFQVLEKSKRLSIIPDAVHKYRQNPSSLTHQKPNYCHCMDAVIGYKALFDFFRETKMNDIAAYRAYHQTKLLMSTFVVAADGLTQQQCFNIFSLFKEAIDNNNLQIVKKSQPFVFKYTCLLLQNGLFDEAYQFLKKFHGHYRERYITKVYISLAWESYKIRLHRKFRKIPLLNRIIK